MSEQATKLIESAQAGTLPAELVRDMIYQGKVPNDHPPTQEEKKAFRVLVKSDKGTYGVSDFDKKDEAIKDAQKRSESEKGKVVVVTKGSPRPLATFKNGKPVRESLDESADKVTQGKALLESLSEADVPVPPGRKPKYKAGDVLWDKGYSMQVKILRPVGSVGYRVMPTDKEKKASRGEYTQREDKLMKESVAEQFAREVPKGKYTEKDLKAKGYSLLRKSPQSYNVMKDGKHVGIVYKSAPGWIAKCNKGIYSDQKPNPIDAVMSAFRLTGKTGGPMIIGKGESIDEAKKKLKGTDKGFFKTLLKRLPDSKRDLVTLLGHYGYMPAEVDDMLKDGSIKKLAESIVEGAFKVMGKSSAGTEELDSFDSKQEAEKMAAEYRMAFGKGWKIWVTGGNGKGESLYLDATGVDEDDFIARTKEFLEKCGKPHKPKKPTMESELAESVELNEGEAAFVLDTPEHMTQLEELLTNLSAAQVPYSISDDEETEEVILSWPEGFSTHVEAAMEALGIATFDDNDLTPEAGADYQPYQHMPGVSHTVEDDAMEAETAQTLSGKPKGDLPSLFKPVGDDPKKTQDKKKKKKSGLLAKFSQLVQRAHGKGQPPMNPAQPEPIPATEGDTMSDDINAADLIELRLQGHDVDDLLDGVAEVSKKELLARFGGKQAKPFKDKPGKGKTDEEQLSELTLTPAYGRDYKSKAAVLADFNANKDFIIADIMHPYSGKPANKQDLKAAGETRVNIRYQGNRKVVVVNLKEDDIGEEGVPGEDKAHKAGTEFGKANKLKDVKNTEQMYQACVKAGVKPSLFDIFKYAAQDVWRKTGQLKGGAMGGGGKPRATESELATTEVFEARKPTVFKMGDKVRYASQWLRNTGQITGPTPFKRGVVVGLSKLGDKQLVKVDWKDGQEPMNVLAANLHKIGTWEPN